tara:strand:- start:237 stop:1391 length:1155 start_codon:yes stop_codon:yes gene_type:complete
MADFKIYSSTSETHITPAVGKIKLGSSNVSKIYQGSTLVWPVDDENDDYVPVDGANFRFLAHKSTSPRFGIFDDQFNEVSTGYTFSSLPNSLYRIGAISDNFTYMVAAGNGSDETALLSTDNGESWSSLGFVANNTECYMSKSGQVIVIESGTTLEVSNDYGSNFTTHNLSNIITSGTSVLIINKASLSAGGKYILIAVYVTGNPVDENDNRYLVSTDYGTTFNDVTSTVGFPNLKTNNNYVSVQDILVSGDGQYQIYFQGSSAAEAYGYSRYSNDYGVTFSDKAYPLVDYNENGRMSNTGQYFILGTSTQAYYSDDYGASTPLSTINNTKATYLGVSNSGKYSFTSRISDANNIEYSDDFFSTFTPINSSTSVFGPYHLVDIS